MSSFFTRFIEYNHTLLLSFLNIIFPSLFSLSTINKCYETEYYTLITLCQALIVSSVGYNMALKADKCIGLECKHISKPDTKSIPIIVHHLLKDGAGEKIHID